VSGINGLVLCVVWQCLLVWYCVWFGRVNWFLILFGVSVIIGLFLYVLRQSLFFRYFVLWEVISGVVLCVVGQLLLVCYCVCWGCD